MTDPIEYVVTGPDGAELLRTDSFADALAAHGQTENSAIRRADTGQLVMGKLSDADPIKDMGVRPARKRGQIG
jgi:hypothetical protein